MPLHAPLFVAHLALSPVVATLSPAGDVALLEPNTLAPRRTLDARGSSLFASGRRLFVVEPGDDDFEGSIRALDVGARVTEAWREPLDGDAALVTARGAGVLLGRTYAGAYLSVIGGAGGAVAPPTSAGDTGGYVWAFGEGGGWWTLDVRAFDGATLGPSARVGRVPAWGTGCGARAVDAGGALVIVTPTDDGVDVASAEGIVHLASTQPCVEDAIALDGGRIAVLLGPVAELASSALPHPWRLDAQLPHATTPTRRLARGVRDDTVLVATDGPLLELDLATGGARYGGSDASAVVVLR